MGLLFFAYSVIALVVFVVGSIVCWYVRTNVIGQERIAILLEMALAGALWLPFVLLGLILVGCFLLNADAPSPRKPLLPRRSAAP